MGAMLASRSHFARRHPLRFLLALPSKRRTCGCVGRPALWCLLRPRTTLVGGPSRLPVVATHASPSSRMAPPWGDVHPAAAHRQLSSRPQTSPTSVVATGRVPRFRAAAPTWGTWMAAMPGVDLSSGIVDISCGFAACVARRDDGSALVWGPRDMGDASSASLTSVVTDVSFSTSS